MSCPEANHKCKNLKTSYARQPVSIISPLLPTITSALVAYSHFATPSHVHIAMAGQHETVQGLGISPSQHVVGVCVIDSTARIRVPTRFFIQDPVPGHETLEVPAFVFLIQHPLGKKVLFDLGLRKDTESFSPVIKQGLTISPMTAHRDIAAILQEDGHIALGEIDSIIWR